jgi:hypothetical protein
VRKLIATVAAAVALAGAGLATHTAMSNTPAGASFADASGVRSGSSNSWPVYILPYIEQENVYRAT